MKTQMRFQKYICLAMLLVGALSLLYAFFYCSGALSELGQAMRIDGSQKVSIFTAAEGKYDALLYNDIQPFNNLLMIMGIVMVLLAVLLYITGCNKRRNYYISNYIATGVCAGGDIVISIILLIMCGSWHAKFLNVDFEAWYKAYEVYFQLGTDASTIHYSTSQLWFILGYVVYAIVIVAAIILILNLVWKVLLMKGEKKLLDGSTLEGGAV